MTVQVTSDGAAVVDTEYFWIPVDEHTPRGAKLQLLGQGGGVAVYANYDGDKFWTHWCPLPKNSRKVKPYPSVPEDVVEVDDQWYSIGQMLIGAIFATLIVVIVLLIFTGIYIGKLLT